MTSSAPSVITTTYPYPPSSSSYSSSSYLTNLGLGYAIAIALGFLVLLSSLLLASYVCCRASRFRSLPSNADQRQNPNTRSNSDGGLVLPRIIFVAEEEEEGDGEDPDRAEHEHSMVGLNQNVINSYPKFQFSSSTTDTMCSICLCEYKEAEMLRMMPECRHYFHLCCIDAWLKLNGSCPVCRNSPLPTPLSTPLQEVVPLSQYAADRRRR